MLENKPKPWTVESSLQWAFKEIFAVAKVVFDQPGESQEQDCIFIEVENSWNTFKDGRALSKVTGNLIMFGPGDKLTLGFFSRAIAQAPATLTKPLFFFDFEENTKRRGNIVQRSVSFVYFFDSQYDPETGSITSVNFTLEES